MTMIEDWKWLYGKIQTTLNEWAPKIVGLIIVGISVLIMGHVIQKVRERI
jgi:cyanate permease